MTHLPLELSNFFLAMQAGPPGLKHLESLLHETAEYFEPFSGQEQPHRGPKEIIEAFSNSRSDAFSDAVIELSAVEIVDDLVTVHWTCISKAIPGGSGSGTNVFRLHKGKIISLVTTLDPEADQ